MRVCIWPPNFLWFMIWRIHSYRRQPNLLSKQIWDKSKHWERKVNIGKKGETLDTRLWVCSAFLIGSPIWGCCQEPYLRIRPGALFEDTTGSPIWGCYREPYLRMLQGALFEDTTGSPIWGFKLEQESHLRIQVRAKEPHLRIQVRAKEPHLRIQVRAGVSFEDSS